jgi:hypothetical protein
MMVVRPKHVAVKYISSKLTYDSDVAYTDKKPHHLTRQGWSQYFNGIQQQNSGLIVKLWAKLTNSKELSTTREIPSCLDTR